MLCHVSPSVSFAIMLFATASYFFVELAVGYIFKSLVLQADAYHMLSDVASLIIGFVANKMSTRNALNSKGIIKNTFGWVRSEVVGALVNSIFLIAMCFSIFVEAIIRLTDPEQPQKPLIVMGVAIGGLFVNLIGLLLFHDHAHGHSHHTHTKKPKKSRKSSIIGNLEDKLSNNIHKSTGVIDVNASIMVEHDGSNQDEVDDVKITLDKVQSGSSQMNMKGVYLHIVGDFIGSVIVIISCLVIHYVKQKWVIYLDPSLSLLSVSFLLIPSIPLAKNAIKILLQTIPDGFDVNAIKKTLLDKFPEILEIHDFHLWQLAGSRNIASLHAKFKFYNDFKTSSENIKAYFHSIGIHSLTLQPEIYDNEITPPQSITENDCLLACPADTNCKPNQCC